MAIGISSSYGESSTEYIKLDSKEDIIAAYKKLSFKDKRFVEIAISKEKMKRVNLKNNKQLNK